MAKAGYGLFGGVVGLLSVIATRTFGAGDGGIGALLGARGAGALLGPLIGKRFTRSTARIILVCGVSAGLYGLGYVLVPQAPTIAVAAVFVFIAHLGGGANWTLSTYGLQVETPDALRGRIFAADFALVTLTLSVSFLAAGAASERFGPVPVLRVLAGVSVLWGVAYLALTRRVRRAAAAEAAELAGRPALTTR